MQNTTTKSNPNKKLFKFLICSISLLFIILNFSSCKKTIQEKDELPPKQQTTAGRFSGNCDLSTTICEDCSFQELISSDTSEYPTTLGSVYNNPYSIANMTTAYNYIYSSNIPSVGTNHYYVRFKPSSVDQLNILDSLDLELYDYPLNRTVFQEGDYWPDAYNGLGPNEFPWLYTVVESSFSFPANIQTEVLESLYIPENNDILEDEALYITGNAECDSVNYLSIRQQRKEYYQDLLPNPCDMGVYDNCGGGGNPPPLPPGGPTGPGGSNPAQKPSGQINFKTYTGSGNFLGASAPLKFAKVVGRRFLKIDKTYTDVNGNFQLSKRFPRKVTLIVKFKASTGHGQHSVRTNFINFGIWRSMFPMKKNIGTYKGNSLQSLNYEFQKGTNSIKRKTRDWIAAVMMNTTEEARLFLSENNMLTLADDLRFYLYAPGEQTETPTFDFLRRSNAPYLNQDRHLFDEILSYGASTILAAATVVVAVYSGLTPGGIALSSTLAAATFSSIPHKPDVYFQYRTSDINSLTATKVSMSMGQQLGILYLYNLSENSSASGASRYTYLGSRKYVLKRNSFDTYAPFGDNISDPTYGYKPEVIAIWEAFAQHFGNTIADRIYGTGAGSFELQGKQWSSNSNISSNLKYLEEFDPSIGVPNDYFNWIPVGLINDLIDNNIDAPPVIDNVSGFTYQDIQNALINRPSEMSQFKSLLQAIKPSQTVQINQLFTSYGY